MLKRFIFFFVVLICNFFSFSASLENIKSEILEQEVHFSIYENCTYVKKSTTQLSHWNCDKLLKHPLFQQSDNIFMVLSSLPPVLLSRVKIYIDRTQSGIKIFLDTLKDNITLGQSVMSKVHQWAQKSQIIVIHHSREDLTQQGIQVHKTRYLVTVRKSFRASCFVRWSYHQIPKIFFSSNVISHLLECEDKSSPLTTRLNILTDINNSDNFHLLFNNISFTFNLYLDFDFKSNTHENSFDLVYSGKFKLYPILGKSSVQTIEKFSQEEKRQFNEKITQHILSLINNHKLFISSTITHNKPTLIRLDK